MKVHILGAGPAGLSLGFYLINSGVDVQVYEKESIPGGMARSWKWNNFIVDTGPHILHTPLKEIWTDWKYILRDSLFEKQYFAANLKNDRDEEYLFDYPINVNQIMCSRYWTSAEIQSLKLELEKYPSDLICSSADSFHEYMVGLVGPTIVKHFFTIYPEKVWGISPHDLLADWAPKRIRRTTETEAFFKDQYCGISKGTGYLFKKITDQINNQIKMSRNFSHELTGLEVNQNRITRLSFGNSQKINVQEDDIVVSTLPISILSAFLGMECNSHSEVLLVFTYHMKVLIK